MSTMDRNNYETPLKKLKKQWLIWSIIVFSLWSVIFLFFSFSFQLMNGILWGSISLGIIIWQNLRLYKFLPNNRRDSNKPLLPGIGIANWISLTRGILIAFLSGFILIVKPGSWIIWIPAYLYLVAALLDYIDGIVARLTDTTTILGGNLDMEMDGLGVLIATMVAVQYGQVPLIYLSVGLARYFFIAGIFIRKKRNLKINPLNASPFRRGLAGAQMGFLVAVLFPVFKPPVTHIVAIFFMTPFLITFLLDWFTVSNKKIPSLQTSKLNKNLPLFLRSFLLIWVIVHLFSVSSGLVFNNVFLIILILFSVLGIASRTSSFAVMLWCGFLLRVQPDNIWNLSLLFISLLIFFTGSGRYSIWKPEDYLLYRRVGE